MERMLNFSKRYIGIANKGVKKIENLTILLVE